MFVEAEQSLDLAGKKFKTKKFTNQRITNRNEVIDYIYIIFNSTIIIRILLS